MQLAAWVMLSFPCVCAAWSQQSLVYAAAHAYSTLVLSSSLSDADVVLRPVCRA